MAREKQKGIGLDLEESGSESEWLFIIGDFDCVVGSEVHVSYYAEENRA